MRLKIIRIVERGVPGRERLHLSVLANTNLTSYAVFDTSYIGQDIVVIPKRAYWFTDYLVKAGDHVIVYTCDGTNSTGKRKDGFTNHFFYWGLNQPLWGKSGACAVLLEISDWETSPFE